jgi:FkbM family methyltransferase
MSRTIDALTWIGHRIGKPPGWERVVRLVAPPEKCRGLPERRLRRDDIIFIARPGVPLGWHIAFFGTYEPELRRVFRGVLATGGIAVDAGANVGWHTLLMARLVGEGGRVLAVEANPSVRTRLVEHLELNEIRNVEVIPCALGDAQGSVEFQAPAVDDPAAGDGHVVDAGDIQRRDVIRVEVRTLDAILEPMHLERLDLIKIDVEGFEWPVLKGAERAIAKFRPHIVFEYIDEYADRGGGNPQALADFFEMHGYGLSTIGRNGSESIVEGRWPSAANLWAMPSPRAGNAVRST